MSTMAAIVIAVLTREGEVRLDIGPQHPRAGRLGDDAGLHVGDAVVDHLSDEVVLPSEGVADQATADQRPSGDLGEGRSGIAHLGDGVDGRPTIWFRRAVSMKASSATVPG